MEIKSRHIQISYYIEDGLIRYKCVYSKGERGDQWQVWGANGIHTYNRLLDHNGRTHKRIIDDLKKVLRAEMEPADVSG